ncbi:inner membrane protein [Motilibacter peucedani]|uniref:Inner membrane protein n=1 Tax=Motilibacter peucedani TaxID=598650 RepID=A0A420XP20_9ACTN|nr:metal-dependent hydrolase [Motilibacter peucedani]RKS73937.1 inner membrane protein [Motilibacter peucedani]
MPLLGPLDWVGHLATTGVCLAALAPEVLRRRQRLLALTAACSVAIDVDHAPYYLHLTALGGGGRPVTHSLFTPVALGVAALLVPRWRDLLLAAAAGVCLHFVRDVATGPGLALLAPLDRHRTLLPYAVYAGALAALSACAVLRDARRTSPPARRAGDPSAR